MTPHPHPVAENGASGNGAGRIDRGNGDCLPPAAQSADIGVDQSRFARARRAGEANDRRAAGFGADAAMDQVGDLAAAFHERDAFGKRRRVAGG